MSPSESFGSSRIRLITGESTGLSNAALAVGFDRNLYAGSADPVDAVRAVGDRGRQISEYVSGRIYPRIAVNIATAAVTLADRPVRSASSRSMPIPACDTTPWPSVDTFTVDAAAIFFTCEMPSRQDR